MEKDEPQVKQVTIDEISKEELWKLAFEQQKQVTVLLAQLQQAQANIAAIEAEIAKRPQASATK